LLTSTSRTLLLVETDVVRGQLVESIREIEQPRGRVRLGIVLVGRLARRVCDGDRPDGRTL